MKTYLKKEGDKLLKKTLKEIVIKKDGRVTYNPTEDMVLADGWVEYVAPTPPEVPMRIKLKRAKESKVREIERYDSSDSVNTCVISMGENDIHYWADKTERSSLKTAVQDCLAMGRTEYRLDLRDAGVSVNVSCEKLLQMLAGLEVYAIDCYNKTTDHIFAVNALQTIEEVEAYDFMVGYPNILTIEL